MTAWNRLFEHGSIRRRLTAAVILLAVLPILVLLFSLYALDRVENDARQIKIASSLRMSAFVIAAQLNSHIATPKDYKREIVLDELQRMRRALETLERGSPDEGLRAVDNASVRQRLVDARHALKLYEEITQETFQDIENGAVPADELEEVTQEVLGSAYGFLALSNLATHSLDDHATSAMNRIRVVQGIAVLLSLLIVAVTLWAVRRFILQPIPTFFAAFESVSKGQYGEKVEIGTENEFGHLATAFNSMSTSLEAAHRKLLFKQTEVLEKNAALERASNLKSHFVANMSHELRTPLNAILGYHALLERGVYGEAPAKMQEPLHGIGETAKSLLKLINDILDVAKSDAGKMDLYIESFRVENLLQEIGEMLRPLAVTKGLELEVDNEAKVPTVTSDLEKIRRILVNLGANAIKFTRRGKVQIRLLPEVDGVFGIAVQDTGCGIAAENLEAVFEDFRQLDGSSSREQEGTGLGLAISRRLARHLGGDIEVESTLGEGSTFTFRLPVFVRVEGDAVSTPGSLDEEVQT